MTPLLDKEGLGEVEDGQSTPLNPPLLRGDDKRAPTWNVERCYGSVVAAILPASMAGPVAGFRAP